MSLYSGSDFVIVDKISKSYDGVILAPSPVSFTLSNDNPVALLNGENGSGKSTLIRILLRSILPTSGRFRISDNQQVSVVFQSNGVLPHISVQQNLLILDVTLEQVHKVSMQLSFPIELLRIPARCLSGGQEKRLQLARCILSNRSIWILDEPSAHSDAKFVILLVDVLCKHVQAGGLLLLTSHDAEFINRLTKCIGCHVNTISVERNLISSHRNRFIAS